MISISFIYPTYLLFLLLIPVFIFIHFITLKSMRGVALKFANFEAIAKIKGVDFFSKNIVILFLSIIIVFLLVFSLSGTVLHTIIEASDYSFLIALDTSQSMSADDFPPSRIEAAKSSAIEFIDTVPVTTRAGVLSFSGNSLIEQSLTDNMALVKSAIRDVSLSNIAGTDIYEVAITGTNLLKGEDAGAIILISDGQINVGNINEAIRYTNENDVIIHTIAVGTLEGGNTNYGISKLDEDSLRALAYNTGGEFFNASDMSELSESFQSIIKKTSKKVGINISNYLLIIAILLFSLEYYLINTKYRSII